MVILVFGFLIDETKLNVFLFLLDLLDLFLFNIGFWSRTEWTCNNCWSSQGKRPTAYWWKSPSIGSYKSMFVFDQGLRTIVFLNILILFCSTSKNCVKKLMDQWQWVHQLLQLLSIHLARFHEWEKVLIFGFSNAATRLLTIFFCCQVHIRVQTNRNFHLWKN